MMRPTSWLPGVLRRETHATHSRISSIAGRELFGDLNLEFEATSEHRVSLESVGGVDAAMNA